MASATLRTLTTATQTVGCVALAAASLSFVGCQSESAPASHGHTHEVPVPAIGYLEIVTTDADATIALYESVHGLSFGPKDAALGNARVAEKSGGTLIAVREPLAEHEGPIMRAYVAVDDVEKAVQAAEAGGASVAYPPTKQGEYGTFAIVIKDDVQHGFWQKPR